MITLALVGVGRWGVNFLKTIERLHTCRIKYVAAKTGVNLLELPEHYIKTTDYRDFFKYPDIDGVIISTPGSTHYELIKQFTSRGYFVLVEKPFTTNNHDALDIKKSLESKKSTIMVGHIYLYNPAFLVIKKLIPKIGQLKYISFKGYNWGPFRDDMSALWEWAPHGISLCLDIIGDLPSEVSAWAIEALRPSTKLYDNVLIQLKFKQNISCLLEFGWLYPIKRRELIIHGSRSTILFDDLAERKITLFEGLGPKIIQGRIVTQQAKVSFPSYQPVTPLELELKEFISFIKSGKQPKTDLSHALKVIAIIDAAEKSLVSKGKVVNLKN